MFNHISLHQTINCKTTQWKSTLSNVKTNLTEYNLIIAIIVPVRPLSMTTL